MTKSVDEMTEAEKMRHWATIAQPWLDSVAGGNAEVTTVAESADGSRATITVQKPDANRT